MSFDDLDESTLIVIEKNPAFILEHKFFDKLHTVNAIAFYAMLQRLYQAGIAFNLSMIASTLKLNKKETEAVYEELACANILKRN